jgi:ATP-dependent helicase HrpB
LPYVQVSEFTRIEVVTEGVLTNRLLRDPFLSGVAAVILDEFHERSINADLALAMLIEVQEARPELRLLVMSATLDGARVAALLRNCPIVTSPGRAFPVDLRYSPPGTGFSSLQSTALAPSAVAAAVVTAVLSALATETGGVLAFLPGAPEIRRAAQLLRESGAVRADVDLCVLYGDLPREAQAAAIRPAAAGRRKVVLATSVAETSLTIDGVRVVVDAGLSRRQSAHPCRGFAARSNE